MSKKAYDILNLSEDEFVAELMRENSRVRKNCRQWTYAWLKAHGIKFTQLDNRFFGADPKAETQGMALKCIDLIDKSVSGANRNGA